MSYPRANWAGFFLRYYYNRSHPFLSHHHHLQSYTVLQVSLSLSEVHVCRETIAYLVVTQ